MWGEPRWPDDSRAPRAAGRACSERPVVLQCDHPIESPAIGPDGVTIYLTDHFHFASTIRQHAPSVLRHPLRAVMLRSGLVRGLGMLVICGGAGCLTKPSPPASTCGAWDAQPTQIPLMIDLSTQAATSPWLSDDGNELWFALLSNNGDPTTATLMRASRIGGMWGPPAPSPLGPPVPNTADDNPFVDADRNVWFDSTRMGTRMIFEAPNLTGGNLGPPAPITALLAAKEPALSPDGLSLIYQDIATNKPFRSNRASKMDSFTAGQALAVVLDVESPSIARDGATVYLSDHASTEIIVSGKFDPSGSEMAGLSEVGAFQQGGIYFDANISTDDKTLVFASNLVSPHAQLYYVTRTCTP
jgi:hypothetical protein